MPKSSQTIQQSAALVVTAQQSRFHVDASDTSNSKQVRVFPTHLPRESIPEICFLF